MSTFLGEAAEALLFLFFIVCARRGYGVPICVRQRVCSSAQSWAGWAVTRISMKRLLKMKHRFVQATSLYSWHPSRSAHLARILSSLTFVCLSVRVRPNTFNDKQSQIAERKTGNGRGPGNHSNEAG
jgi:hypothetical protein